MSFGLDACGPRNEKKIGGSSGIYLPDDSHIKEVEEEGYKYLGILQSDKT